MAYEALRANIDPRNFRNELWITAAAVAHGFGGRERIGRLRLALSLFFC
jgi:hypothetical protein